MEISAKLLPDIQDSLLISDIVLPAISSSLAVVFLYVSAGDPDLVVS